MGRKNLEKPRCYQYEQTEDDYRKNPNVPVLRVKAKNADSVTTRHTSELRKFALLSLI
jgi:hypothetical protein